MAQEIEVKFALKDRAELVRKLHDIGGQRRANAGSVAAHQIVL